MSTGHQKYHMDKVLHIRVELTARAPCFDDGTISEMTNFNSEADISNNRSGGVWDETKPNFNPIFFFQNEIKLSITFHNGSVSLPFPGQES